MVKTDVTVAVVLLLIILPFLTGHSSLPSELTNESIGDLVGDIVGFWSETLQSIREDIIPTKDHPYSPHASNNETSPGHSPFTVEDETQVTPVTVETYDTGSLGLRVREGPSLSADILGKVFDGTRFVVVLGPQSSDGYEWLRVRLEGWSAANWLSGELQVGGRASVKDTGDLGLRVRAGAGLGEEVLGKVYDTTRLMILEGPVSHSGFQWFKVRLEGWSAARYLREPVPVAEDHVRPAGEQPSADVLQRKVERLREVLAADVRSISLPSKGFTLQRILTPNIVDRSDQFYFLSLDYRFLAIKTLRFSEELLDMGEVGLASEYIESVYRYIKLSNMLEDASVEQLMASVEISQDLIIAKAAETALRFTVMSVAPGLPAATRLSACVALDLFTSYVDYSIDTGVKEAPIEVAKRRALTEFAVRAVFKVPAVREAIGEPVKGFVLGESGLYQRLERLIDIPEVREAIMRAVANGAEYLAIEAAGYDARYIANQVVNRLVEVATKK